MTKDAGRGRLDAAIDRRERLHTAIVRMEKALAAPAVKEQAWRTRIQRELKDLGTVFRDHIAVTEGDAGLFDEVIRAAPRLSHAVDVLRAEHVEIAKAIDAAAAWLDSPPPPHAEIRDRLLGLLGSLVRHRQQGADLVYEAYEVDIGGLD